MKRAEVMALPPNLKSLQARLLALLLLLVTLVWLGAAGFIWVDASDELDELLDGHLAQSAALLIAQQGVANAAHADRRHSHPGPGGLGRG